MKFFTIGYGGRHPVEFARLLTDVGVQTLVDVRLRPERASMGSYVKAKAPEKGIEGLLARAGIAYVSVRDLGNKFLDCEDWRERYARYLEESGAALTEPLRLLKAPFCLLCAEKKVGDCHREQLAAFLLQTWHGSEVEHI
jgi:uncharacterized protein (DUF488 family)